MHHRDDHNHHDTSQWQPQVMQLSALKGSGLPEFWAAIDRFRELQTANGQLAARRQRQDQAWMWDRIHAGLVQRFKADAAVRDALPALAGEVLAGRLAASVAARRLLDLFH
jgi:LAO/AO transport system kinase